MKLFLHPAQDLDPLVSTPDIIADRNARQGDFMADDLSEPQMFPMARAAQRPFDPAPELGRLIEEAPVSRVRLWDGSTPWEVNRYEDARAVLAR
ncbi:hypothetical protein [Microbispora sp. CA-102843]|uniref:hypothetical protein n=1 Tax=Microbispora sp. CA-102843 TaxID=3239952 RepID=UPI003D8D6F94